MFSDKIGVIYKHSGDGILQYTYAYTRHTFVGLCMRWQNRGRERLKGHRIEQNDEKSENIYPWRE